MKACKDLRRGTEGLDALPIASSVHSVSGTFVGKASLNLDIASLAPARSVISAAVSAIGVLAITILRLSQMRLQRSTSTESASSTSSSRSTMRSRRSLLGSHFLGGH